MVCYIVLVKWSLLCEKIKVIWMRILDKMLSGYIINKISYMLSKTSLHIGVYAYHDHKKKIRYTEYIPGILTLDQAAMESLSSDAKRFCEFLDKIRENPIPDEPGVYQNGERYIRLEEIRDHHHVFGVAADVTAEITKRRQIEVERDMDALTGLYNRRGQDMRLSSLFSRPEDLGHSAMVMMDADALKEINDTYGHEKGDIYLRKIAEMIHYFGAKGSMASRPGGDEFVLFLYGYESEEELIKTIKELEYLQNHKMVVLGENINVPLRFSFGYCLTNGDTDYQRLLKDADEKMYKNKLERRNLFLQKGDLKRGG